MHLPSKYVIVYVYYVFIIILYTYIYRLVLYMVARNIDRALFTTLAGCIDPPGFGYYANEDDEEDEDVWQTMNDNQECVEHCKS